MSKMGAVTRCYIGFIGVCTCLLYSTQAIQHGRNLVWTQTPLLKLGVSRIVGIAGDPTEWVPSGNVHVRHISAPHIGWKFSGLTYSYAKQTLFWSETSNKKIQGLILNGTTDTITLFGGTSSVVEGLAVDWISNNLYWSDSLYNWIVMCPLTNAYTNDRVYRLVARTKLTNPHSIALDPKNGRLFWTDWGIVPKIEVSDLLGANRRTIVDADLGHPRGLVIDFTETVLYWVDSLKDTVESADFNGNNRRIVAHQDGTIFFGVAIYREYLFVTEQLKGHLRVYNKSNGDNVINYQLGYTPDGIVMYDQDLQPDNSSECDALGCSQFCINQPPGGAVCYCGDGYVLDQDNRTCEYGTGFVQPSHVYAIRDAICLYPVNLPDMSLGNVTLDSQCFMEPGKGYLALTYDAEEHELYYTENYTKSIGKVSMKFGQAKELIVRGTGVVQGLAYDWMTGNLFWTDSQFKHITMARKNGMYQTVVVDKDLDHPLGIAVYPSRGQMFWTDVGSTPKVEMAGMDGSNRVVLTYNYSVISPNHVFIDFQNDILYWSDSGTFSVSSYDLNTGQIKLYYQKDDTKFFGITKYMDYLLWTSPDDMNGIHAARMDTEVKVRGILHPHVGLASDLVTVDTANQPRYPSTCNAVDNGNCQQLCIPTSNETYICACGVGYTLDENGYSCSSEIAFDNYLLVTDAYQKQIYQIEVSTGKVHAIPLRKDYRAVAIDLDPVKNRLYWTDNANNAILSSFIDGKQEIVIRKLPNDSVVDGIAVDSINRLLFYTCTGLDVIVVMSLDSPSMFKTIVNESLDEPRDIIVDPYNGIILWSDWGASPKIETALMDGTNRSLILSLSNTSWPNALALDFDARNLYWADAKNDHIGVINLDTKVKKIILHEDRAHYFGLTLMGGYMYITDWMQKHIRRMPKGGGPLEKLGPSRFARLNGIVGYNSSSVRRGYSNCLLTTCSELCLPVSNRRHVCACADNSAAYKKARCNFQPQIHEITDSNPVTLQLKKNAKGSNTGLIVGMVILGLVAAAVITVAVVYGYKRYQSTFIPHDRLVEDNRVDAFYRITFPDTAKDETNFDSGIDNPSYSTEDLTGRSHTGLPNAY